MSAPHSRPPLERRGLLEAARFDGAVLVGTAIRFNTASEPLGDGGKAFVEMIAPEALRRLPERRDVKALVGHDSSRVVGSTKAGTLTLTTDATGLHFRLLPPDSPEGHTLVESVRRGDLDGVSFGFKVLADTWREREQPPVRVVTDIDLFEISFVAWPAYRAAGVTVEARALEHAAALVTRTGTERRSQELEALSRRLAALR